MIGPYSKFQFLFLLCSLILSLFGKTKNLDDLKEIISSGLLMVVVMIVFISMIFIYIMTNYNSNDW